MRVLIGARYDMVSFEEKKKQLKNDFSHLSPMLGLSCSVTGAMSVYASAGRAFAPPSSRTDGSLEPEISRKIESGIKHNWFSGKIRSTLAVYQLEKQDMAIPDKNGFIQQTGSQRSRGIEFEVQAQMTERCASTFSYAYTETEMTEFAEPLVTGTSESNALCNEY